MSDLKALKRAVLPPWLRYFAKSWRAYRKLNSMVRKHGLPPLDANPLCPTKHSDTLFILGSGASVLTYTQEEWGVISRHDTLGFDYWALHPFTPTYFVMELAKIDWHVECMVRNFAARPDYFRTARVFLKDADRHDAASIEQYIHMLRPHVGSLELLWDAEIPVNTIDELGGMLAWLDRLGCFSGSGPWAVPRNRASLFLDVNLAVRAGYKNIVLCGVDLNNTDYFFRSPGYQPPADDLCIPPAYQSGRVHKTNDPQYGEMTIAALLDLFDRVVCQPRGIVLSVAKASSALHPRLPAYFG